MAFVKLPEKKEKEGGGREWRDEVGERQSREGEGGIGVQLNPSKV